jgi:hypothetical protein
MDSPVAEFLVLVRRNLGAEDARILEPGEELPEGGGGNLRYELPGGRALVVSFASPPSDLPARQRRAELLVDAFRSVLTPEKAATSRAPRAPSRSLHEELRALSERASASDAIVIDARSPIVWGAAVEAKSGAPEALAEAPSDVVQEAPRSASEAGKRPAEARAVAPPGKRPRGLWIVRTPHAGSAENDAGDSISERAIRAVRALPQTATLHKGGHVHHLVSEPGFGVFARSFAGIYVLILAFRDPVDELRTERAVMHALPTIERLVLALPPLDPTPRQGGVVALRPRLRRR